MHLDDLRPGTTADAVVVIDVFRAFTAAPWCYAAGATSVLLAPTVKVARLPLTLKGMGCACGQAGVTVGSSTVSVYAPSASPPPSARWR